MSILSPASLPARAAASGALSPLVLACLAATWLIWGSTYLAIKYALVSFPPFFQMGTRFLCAGALLMAWMRWRGAAWPDRVEWRNALVLGTLMLGGGFGGTAYAEVSVSSGLVVAFIAISPLLMALFDLFWGARPDRREIVAIALGLVGVSMLTQGPGFRASPIGLAAMVVACTAWSLGSVLSKRSLRLAKGAMGFASEMLCGGLVLLAMAAIFEGGPIWPAQPVAIAAWLYLVVFGSLLAFTAYMVLLERAPVTLASSYTFVNPVIAMLLGVTIAGEMVTPFEWAAVSIALIGVVLLLWRPSAR